MLKEDIAAPLQAIISSMYNLPNQSITLEEPNRGISVTINLKNYSYMNISYTQHKEKEKTNISFETQDFPVYAYHNSIARLAPIYDQLLFLGKHPKFANSDLMMSFASTISNVSLMLSEETLIKTENNITDRLPSELRQEAVVFCGPVGEYFVFTIHFVKVKGTPSSVSMSALNQNMINSFSNNYNDTNNSNANGGSQFAQMPNSYSTTAVSQMGNVNNTINTSPGSNSNTNANNASTPPNTTSSNNASSSNNINLSATSSSTTNSINSSNNNLSSQARLPISRSNGNLNIMGSSSINSPLLETASISPSSLNYESPAFWRPFAQDTIFPHLGREYIVCDSVMLRTKFKIQSVVLSQLKALQMLLSAISVNLSVQADEEETEEEEIENDDDN